MRNYDPIIGVGVMIILSIVIGYFLTMTIILRTNNTNNINRVYQALLMGFWMGLIELVMVGILMRTWARVYTLYLVILIIGIVVLSLLIYYQVGVDENQYMLSMISHHQMAIDMTKQVYARTDDPRLKAIMNNILESQQREINQMYAILKERGV